MLTDATGRAHPYSLAPGQAPSLLAETLRADARDLLPPPFAGAVAVEPRPFVQAIFDYEAPHMVVGRLAMLGDAAFVVRPHTAMGMAKAAGDALAGYERDRMPVGATIAAYGRRLGADLG